MGPAFGRGSLKILNGGATKPLIVCSRLPLQRRAHSIAYVPMRFWVVSGLTSFCLLASATAQTIDVKGGKAPPTKELPAYRPIVLGKGPNSLINRIDTQALIKGGQKDALVMFTCFVDKKGKMVETAVYRPTPNSDLLQ